MTSPLQLLRDRIDIVPSRHRTRPVLTGTVVIVVLLLAVVGAATRKVPLLPKGGRTVQAQFASANQVSNRTVVRAGGIDVGRVDKVTAGSDPRRASLVTMRITDDAIKLHSDASAQIRWRTLFGGLMYIDLHPGSPSAPPLGDRPIPVRRTSNQVELDQLLQPYDGGTAQAQRNLLQGMRDGLADPQGTIRTIHALAPTLRTVDRGLTPLRGRDAGDLRALVAATSRTVRGLDDAQALQVLVDGLDGSLGVTAARRRQLGQFLELSPASLKSTFTTMRRLRTTLGHLDPLAAQLRPGARALAPAARTTTPAVLQLRGALRESRPLLRSARPAFAALGRASANGVPLMQDLQPALERLDAELLPWLRKRDDGTRLRNYESIGPFWSTLAMAAGEYDSEGYRIRFTVPTGRNSFLSSPIGEGMTRSCRASAVPDSRCGKVVAALARSWFDAKAGKR